MLIVGTITVLISFMGTLTTYATVQSAQRQPGTFVHLIARLDHRQPIEYNALNNPNYLRFTVVDTLGRSVKVIYRNARPDNLQASERLVLKGTIRDGYFECREIVMKCPSKYKETSGYATAKLPRVPH